MDASSKNLSFLLGDTHDMFLTITEITIMICFAHVFYHPIVWKVLDVSDLQRSYIFVFIIFDLRVADIIDEYAPLCPSIQCNYQFHQVFLHVEDELSISACA